MKRIYADEAKTIDITPLNRRTAHALNCACCAGRSVTTDASFSSSPDYAT